MNIEAREDICSWFIKQMRHGLPSTPSIPCRCSNHVFCDPNVYSLSANQKRYNLVPTRFVPSRYYDHVFCGVDI